MTKVILIGSGSAGVLASHALRERGITIIQSPEPTPITNNHFPYTDPILLKNNTISYPDGKSRRRDRRKKKRKNQK